jgi:glycine/D-amino acid oxidase-like deaminating enzyme
MQTITGINNVFEVNKSIIKSAGLSKFDTAISHKAEGQIDTGKMIDSLYKLAIEKDVKILNNISAKSIESDHELSTDHGKIKFEKLIICTNGFAKQFLPDEDINPARAQIIITKPIQDLKFKGIFHFNKGYYYFRNINNRVLLGGGRNLDTQGETTTSFGNTETITNELKHILKTQILPTTDFQFDYSWSGIMGVGQIKSPIIKQVSKNVYCGVRLGGMGVAIGSVVGKEIAELVD